LNYYFEWLNIKDFQILQCKKTNKEKKMIDAGEKIKDRESKSLGLLS